MSQVSIVGVEGSGKTVLMAALGDLYERPDANGYFLSPENPSAFSFSKLQTEVMRNGQWPVATLTDNLKYLNWSLYQKQHNKARKRADFYFLDFAGEIYRLAFGEHSEKEIKNAEKEVAALKEYVDKSNIFVLLINLRDIIDGNISHPRTQETMWLTRAFLDYVSKNSRTQHSHVAVVFSQADTYCDIIDGFGGPKKTFQKFLPHVANLYDNCSVFAVSAVNKTSINDDGMMIPAADFSSSGLQPLMDWIIDTIRQDAEILKNNAKKLLEQGNLEEAFFIASQGDVNDSEVLYLLGRCVEDYETFVHILEKMGRTKRYVITSYGVECFTDDSHRESREEAMAYYAMALKNTSDVHLIALIQSRKKYCSSTAIRKAFFWPIEYLKHLNDLGGCHMLVLGVFILGNILGNASYIFLSGDNDFSHGSRITGLIVGYFLNFLLWIVIAAKYPPPEWESYVEKAEIANEPVTKPW